MPAMPFARVPTIIDKDGQRFRGQDSQKDGTEMRDGYVKPTDSQRITTLALDRDDWAAQFDPIHFQKVGFVYDIEDPMFKNLKVQQSTRGSLQTIPHP